MNYFQAKRAEKRAELEQAKADRDSTAYKISLYEYYKSEFISRVVAILFFMYLYSVGLGLIMGEGWSSLIPFYAMAKTGFIAEGAGMFSSLVYYIAIVQLIILFLQLLISYHIIGVITVMVGVIILEAAEAVWRQPWALVCEALRVFTAVLDRFAPWAVQGFAGYKTGEEFAVLVYYYGVYVLLRCVYNLVQLIRYRIIVQGIEMDE